MAPQALADFDPGIIENPTGYESDPSSLGNLLTNISTTVAIVAGLLLFGMFLYGGIAWITAQGDEERVERAQKILSNAVIGLVIVVAAFFVVQILSTVLGLGNIFNIKIPGPDKPIPNWWNI